MITVSDVSLSFSEKPLFKDVNLKFNKGNCYGIIEAERLAAEEAARIEAERLAAEEAARIEAERLAAEEAARIEAEKNAVRYAVTSNRNNPTNNLRSEADSDSAVVGVYENGELLIVGEATGDGKWS